MSRSKITLGEWGANKWFTDQAIEKDIIPNCDNILHRALCKKYGCPLYEEYCKSFDPEFEDIDYDFSEEGVTK